MMAELGAVPGSLPCPAMTPDYADDAELVDALRNGDEGAFSWLLDRYHAPLHRTARMYVATDAHADEVVQETWVAVLRGIDGFEQRSSLKTWLYRIVMNIARTRGVKESRTIPFSSAAGAAADGAAPTFEPTGSARRTIPSGPVIGRRCRSTGSTSRNRGCSRARRSASWHRSSTPCPRRSARC